MEMFEQIFSGVGLDGIEADRHKFVILCETFLHMYNDIFGKLADYLAESWWPSDPEDELGGEGDEDQKEGASSSSEVHFVVEEERDFDVSNPIARASSRCYFSLFRFLCPRFNVIAYYCFYTLTTP